MDSKLIGKYIGYTLMGIIFTFVFYWGLYFLEKLPFGWGYAHIGLLMITIILVGTLMRSLLN